MNLPFKCSARLVAVIVPVLSIGAALSMGFTLESVPPILANRSAPALPPTARPSTSTPSTAAGRALFVQSCSHCHGDDASGSGEDGDGPDLHSLRISNARIATVVHHGIRGEMPSFAKKFSPADTTALIEYLRTLR